MFNSLEPLNQVAFLLKRRYDGNTLAAHLWRWMEIGYFIRHYNKRLLRDQWIRASDEAGYQETHDALFKALCELRYTAHRGRG